MMASFRSSMVTQVFIQTQVQVRLAGFKISWITFRQRVFIFIQKIPNRHGEFWLKIPNFDKGSWLQCLKWCPRCGKRICAALLYATVSSGIWQGLCDFVSLIIMVYLIHPPVALLLQAALCLVASAAMNYSIDDQNLLFKYSGPWTRIQHNVNTTTLENLDKDGGHMMTDIPDNLLKWAIVLCGIYESSESMSK